MFRRPKLVSLVLALLCSSALTWAADTPGSAPSSEPSSGTSPAPLTTQQMLDKANSILEGADRASQTIGQNLREARRQNDVVKALCLDDKLSQLEVAKLTAAERVASLQASVTSGNTEAVDHDFSVISALGVRISALSGEANQCIGEEKAAVGQGSSLQVTFSPAIPKEDTSSLPSSPNTSTPPVAASPVI